jgi:hypothetical protein
MISFSRKKTTSWAFSVHMGKDSTHPERVQTNTNRYLFLQACSISVKSTIKFSTGVPTMLYTWGGALDPCLGLFLAHRLQVSHTALLIYPEEHGDIKMLGPGWS